MSASTHGTDSAAGRIGFIGAGRLARALAWALDAHGCDVRAVASRSAASAKTLADGTSRCRVMTAQEVADGCDLVFVTTPDSAIEAVASSLRWRTGTGVVHCSGATEVSALAAARDDGAMIGGFHPMQTFADPAVAARTLPGCVITIEAEGELAGALGALAARLGCPVNRLPPGARAAYHAAAGFASQHLNVLLAQAVAIWRTWGASEEAALAALLPLMRGTISSVETAGVAAGMPGPVSRGDAATVAKHMQALTAIDPSIAALYRELCERSVPLAQAAGNIDAAQASAIRSALEDAQHGPDRSTIHEGPVRR